MSLFLQSWKESLSLFIPKNAKRFFGVTLKTILQSYKYIFKHIGWLFILSYILDITFEQYYVRSWLLLIPLFSWLLTIFCMYLIIRPSIKRKSFDYYKQYGLQFIYFILLTMAFSALVALLLTKLGHFKIYNLLLSQTVLLLPFAPIFMSPLLSFMILFMLDSDGSLLSFLKSIPKAIIMIIYNYPFCLIILTFFTFLAFLYLFIICQIGSHMLLSSSSLLSHALLPIPLSVWTNFYTKRIHDQFGLYYPQTIKE